LENNSFQLIYIDFLETLGSSRMGRDQVI